MGTSSSFAQEDAEKECLRMRFLAGEAVKIKDYKEATKYYVIGETTCGGYDAVNYNRLINSIRNTIVGIDKENKEEKTAYTDSVVAAYERMETAGFYEVKNDLLRGSYILQSSKPDRQKADDLFRSGIKSNGVKTKQGYVTFFFFNTYKIYKKANDSLKNSLKKRMITDYFEMSSLIGEAKMPVKTQETITKYLNKVVKECKDILPELKGYIDHLPTGTEARKSLLMNYITLLKNKKCTDADEYGQLIQMYVDVDPTSYDAQKMKADLLISKGKNSEAIKTLRTLKGISTDEVQKQEITYKISTAQFKSKSYTAAYNTALTVRGEHKGNALLMAGQCVGANANNCGSSTFDRKCNNIYAVQLLERARALGANAGSLISTYNNRVPTKDDCFQNGNPASITLSCYNVTVKPCN